MTRFKVKVRSPSKLEILPFSKAVTLNLAEMSVAVSRPSVPYGLIFPMIYGTKVMYVTLLRKTPASSS